MFTGIVEEIGKIKSVFYGQNSSTISIKASLISSDIKLGDSIAVNGVCLTVVKFDNSTFNVDVMNETLTKSSLKNIKSGDLVNLERAILCNGRFGGHIVSGHVDGTAYIKKIIKDGISFRYLFKAEQKITSYMVEKGSVSIDGTSLTLIDVNNDGFEVGIIPHTLKSTILGLKKEGDVVNIEIDIIGKYIKKFIDVNQDSKNVKSKGISKEFLLSNGF